MHAKHYEELCRRFIARKEKLQLEAVQSLHLSNPRRRELPEYKHQIDLYWETGGELATYVNIANAKWRTEGEISQGDVMLLQQVRQKVAAHKAFIITATGFTSGAIAVGQDEGIALHILRPTFELDEWWKADREVIHAWFDAIEYGQERSLWTHEVVHKGLGFAEESGKPEPATGPTLKPGPRLHTARVAAPTAQKTPATPATRSAEGTSTRSGPGWGSGGDGGGGVVKK